MEQLKIYGFNAIALSGVNGTGRSFIYMAFANQF